MNKIFRNAGLAGLLALGLSETGLALTYTDQDLLLVFRKPNGKDSVFNLGSVSNYLGHADGYTSAVTYNKADAAATYGDLTDGPVFALIASTSATSSSRRLWATAGSADASPTQLSAAAQAAAIAKVVNVGRNAVNATSSSPTPEWVVDGSDKLSYTGVMTGGGTLPAGADTLGSYVAFSIAASVPNSVRFFEIGSSSASPKPDAKLIGTFSMTADGTLTFTAGAGGGVVINPPNIASVTRAGSTTSITVPSQSSVNYRLRYVSALTTASISTWNTGPTVPGTGSALTLTDDSNDSTRIYAVEAFQ